LELYTHSPNTLSWSGAHLKHRDFNFLYVTVKRTPKIIATLEATYTTLGGEFRKRTLARPRRRGEFNIKMDLK
jgi:hypothetical protein